MAKKALFYLLLISTLSFSFTACKTTANAEAVAVDDNDRRGPRMRSNTTPPKPGSNPSRDLDRSDYRLSGEEFRDIPADEVERERNSGGITQAEYDRLGLTSTSPEAIAEARQRQRESRQPLPDNPTIEQLRNKPYLAALRTTACENNDCPVYEFRILADYSFYFYGIDNVDLPGHYFAKTTGNPMLDLQQLVIRYRYLNMEGQYPANSERSMDALSATITEVELMGRHKMVTHYTDGPTGLKAIESYLFDLMEDADWTEVIEQAQD